MVVKRDIRLLIAIIGILLSATSTVVIAKTVTVRYVGMRQITSDVVIVDTRVRASCQQRSIAGARCLPASNLLGPAGVLPSFADIFWALGTAGLDGSETILVAGDHANTRDFVAGVLYLCGQAHVEILKPTIENVLRTGRFPSGQGVPRSMLRQRIYRATMRDTAMVLPGEMNQLQRQYPYTIYLNAARLGQSLSAAEDTHSNGRYKYPHRGLQVIYGISVQDAIAWFTRLLARHNKVFERVRVVPVAVSSL